MKMKNNGIKILALLLLAFGTNTFGAGAKVVRAGGKGVKMLGGMAKESAMQILQAGKGSPSAGAAEMLGVGPTATECTTYKYKVWALNEMGQNTTPETTARELEPLAAAACQKARIAETAYRQKRGLQTDRVDDPRFYNRITFEKWLSPGSQYNAQSSNPKSWNNPMVGYYQPLRGILFPNDVKQKSDAQRKQMIQRETQALAQAQKEQDPVKRALMIWNARYAAATAEDVISQDPNIYENPNPEQVARKAAANQAYIDYQIEKELAENKSSSSEIQSAAQALAQKQLTKMAAQAASQEAVPVVSAKQSAAQPAAQPAGTQPAQAGTQPGTQPEQQAGTQPDQSTGTQPAQAGTQPGTQPA